MKNLMSIILVLFLFNCEEETKVAVQKIESAIQVEIKETAGENGKRIILDCKTEKIYTCYNYTIQTERQNKNNGFAIQFTGTSLGPVCLDALGPARTQLDLGVLANGVYSLELNNMGTVNKGVLRVTDIQIMLDFPQLNGIQIITPVYNR